MHTCYEIIGLEDNGDEVGICKFCGKVKNYTKLRGKSKRKEPIIVANDILKIYGGTGRGSNIAQCKEDMWVSRWGIKF